MPTVTFLDVVKLGFTLFVTVNFVQYARSGQARRHMTVFVRRPLSEWFKAVALVIVEVAILVTAIYLLMGLSPILRFSWLSLLAKGEEGTNLMVAPAQIPWFGLIFIGLLALNLPRLARREEEVFRRGTMNWKDATYRSLKFGLIHMVVGVPLGAALALWFSGMFFSWRYFVGGVRESTYYHTLHNGVILAFLASTLVSV
ncbi:MAG: hypothetical protein IT205_09360 [Fimbriimonadaceae bacterium]|nr:hypothetical protein [Fimbriimonadaceae bacterium]